MYTQEVLLSDTFPVMAWIGSATDPDARPLVLPEAIERALEEWQEHPQWHHFYLDHVEAWVLTSLDSEPGESEHYLLQTLIALHRMSYFVQESNYAYLDNEPISTEVQRLLDESNSPRSMDAIFGSEDTSINEMEILCQRYGHHYAEQLVELNQADNTKTNYLECTTKKIDYTSQALHCFSHFLQAATVEEIVQSQPVWVLLGKLLE